MRKLKIGIVTFFKKEKEYGFLLSNDGQKCFFHLSSGGLSKPNPLRESFCFTVLEKGQKICLLPKIGDEIIFFGREGDKGLVAEHWFFLPAGSIRDKLLSGVTTYRFMEQVKSSSATCKFESNNLLEMSCDYPLVKTSIARADSLVAHEWFERRTLSGWEQIEDPRIKFIVMERGREVPLSEKFSLV
ncbi:MAG: hypothetical protein ACOYMB_00170 [Patescibacteria group bacterium]